MARSGKLEKMAFSYNTTESPEEEQAGSALIQEAIQRVDAILAEPDWPEPHPQSSVAAVDKLTPFQPLSHHIANFNLVAVDNLRATGMYIEKTKDVPMTALYSMIRSAVESTSYGLWLLNSGNDDKQAFRCLRLSYENNEDVASLGKAFDPRSESGTKTRKRLLALQQNLKRHKTHNLDQRVTTTDVVTNADNVVPSRRGLTGLQVWKACSGMAHANGQLLPVILERKFVGKADDQAASFWLTSRLTFLGAFLITATENLEAMRSKFHEELQPSNHRVPR
ncbi:hypothetical protein QK290_13395 [Pseudarthrobacter sp. AL07]|uniref:hypothetical protein n=1 Tax=unclassified Pseudarthrobacter TaxID=2647000 RepID=UPI00249BA7AD|nr:MULTISPECIES: hypothetical protein [unclassified Pseudarthrobacter]MDI3195410.1 hypothetical protein [Pseudarthrobacter sp. AL20]MDI3209476.1 hypothetical protein [Pseudarthrobacter sp. AL07]